MNRTALRIAYLNNELRYTCGVSDHLYSLAKELLQRGDTEIHFLTGGGDAVERFRALGVPVTVIPGFMHQARNWFTFSRSVLAVGAYARKHRLQVLHSHTHYHANIAQRAKALCSARTVQTNHGIIFDKGKLKLFNADSYVAVSRHIPEHLLEERVLMPHEIAVIYNGVEEVTGTRKEEPGILRCITASRLIYDKGIDLVFKAWQFLPEEARAKIRLEIAGEGEHEKHLRDMAKKLQVPALFIGNIKDMPAKLLETDVLIVPTRSRSEGFPTIIPTAALAGNLVIASEFFGLRSTLSAEHDLLTFPVGSDERLAEQLLFALEHPEQTAAIKKNLLEKARQVFSRKLMGEKMVQLYYSLVYGAEE